MSQLSERFPMVASGYLRFYTPTVKSLLIASVLAACSSLAYASDDPSLMEAQKKEQQAREAKNPIPYMRVLHWTLTAPGFEYGARDAEAVDRVLEVFDLVCLHSLGAQESIASVGYFSRLEETTGVEWSHRETTASGVRSVIAWRVDRVQFNGYERLLAAPSTASMLPPLAVGLTFQGSPFYAFLGELRAPPTGATRDGGELLVKAATALASNREVLTIGCLNPQAPTRDRIFAQGFHDVMKPISLPRMDRGTEVPIAAIGSLWTNSRRPIRSGLYPLSAQLGMRPADAQRTVAPFSPTFLLTSVIQ